MVTVMVMVFPYSPIIHNFLMRYSFPAITYLFLCIILEAVTFHFLISVANKSDEVITKRMQHLLYPDAKEYCQREKPWLVTFALGEVGEACASAWHYTPALDIIWMSGANGQVGGAECLLCWLRLLRVRWNGCLRMIRTPRFSAIGVIEWERPLTEYCRKMVPAYENSPVSSASRKRLNVT